MIKKNPFHIKQIKRKIKYIDRLNIKLANVEYLTEKYKNITQNLFTVSIGIDRKEEFNICRARLGIRSKVSDLWYPPQENVKSLGRMNEIGESMFYSCEGNNASLGSIEEINAKPGDIITQLYCAANKDLRLIAIGHADKKISWYKSYQEQFFDHIDMDQTERDKHNLIHDWLSDELIKKILPEENYKYKKSIAISKSYFDGFECDGFLFPSVAVEAKCINLILKPDAADKYLVPVKARVVRFLSSTSEGIHLICLKQSSSIVNGVINWEDVTSFKGHHDSFFNGSKKYTDLTGVV